MSKSCPSCYVFASPYLWRNTSHLSLMKLLAIPITSWWWVRYTRLLWGLATWVLCRNARWRRSFVSKTSCYESDCLKIVDTLNHGRFKYHARASIFLDIHPFLLRNWDICLRYISHEANGLADYLVGLGVSLRCVFTSLEVPRKLLLPSCPRMF